VDEVSRVVLALEEHDVAEEVMHFLDRNARIRVVGTASDERQLAEAVRQLEPDAVVAQPALVSPGSVGDAALLAIATRETVGALRSAIEVGARGFFVWPAEREQLAGAAESAVAPVAAAGRRATVLAAYGPRGGAGTTFVATHLAAAIARRELQTVLIDMDPVFGDIAAAVGVPLDDDIRTAADLLPIVDELTRAHLDEVLWTHPDGFRVLIAPEPEDALRIGVDDLHAIVEATAAEVDVVVLHLPRSQDAFGRCGLRLADRVLMVLSLDVLAFRDARRVLEATPDLDEKVSFLVNRARRAEVTPADVERVFGRAPVAVLPSDGGIPSAQDHGRLLPRRGRVARNFDRLAERLLERVPEEVADAG
jgi:pilus assembly protein CpaE